MTEKARFHILTPENIIPLEIFVIADQQPKTIAKGCVLAVHEATGRTMTVHRTRLIPVNNPAVQFLTHQHSVCLNCGKVEGIALDNVSCPQHGQGNCGMIEPKM